MNSIKKTKGITVQVKKQNEKQKTKSLTIETEMTVNQCFEKLKRMVEENISEFRG